MCVCVFQGVSSHALVEVQLVGRLVLLGQLRKGKVLERGAPKVCIRSFYPLSLYSMLLGKIQWLFDSCKVIFIDAKLFKHFSDRRKLIQ